MIGHGQGQGQGHERLSPVPLPLPLPVPGFPFHRRGSPLSTTSSFQRMVSVSRKEVLHILRDPMTLFFTLFFPVVELFMLGYAIETKVTDIPTVVLDQARTQESGALLREFENSDDFKIVEMVHTDAALRQALVAGRARVGIKIP